MSAEIYLSAEIYRTFFESPIGWLEITAGEDGIHSVLFRGAQPRENERAAPPGHAILRACVAQLAEYFRGARRKFDLPLAPAGTDFQLRVWQALRTIPYGKTASYLDIAHALGDPRAVRAVGRANGQNPIAIIVPCHRVIGRNGRLIGYAGGVWRKQWLLQHEGALLV